jgi:hypothetical protein
MTMTTTAATTDEMTTKRVNAWRASTSSRLKDRLLRRLMNHTTKECLRLLMMTNMLMMATPTMTTKVTKDQTGSEEILS